MDAAMSSDLAARIAATPPGMAHATGTGPADTTCRTCWFWAGNTTPLATDGVSSLRPDHDRRRWRRSADPAVLMPVEQACWRYRQIRRSQCDSDDRSHRVDHHWPSCSHYQPYGEPQDEARTKPTKPAKVAKA
jgi:hypothetical protein